jgi:hypothetical protein
MANQQLIPRFSQAAGMVLNYLTSRIEWLRAAIGPDRRRNIEQECGHRDVLPTAIEYLRLFQRDPIAARVIQLFPHECWKVHPKVYEKEDPGQRTPFEQDWLDLGRNLQPEAGYHQDEQGSAIWDPLKRVDELCGIGRYGVLFLGLDDGVELDQPVPKGRKNKLLYMTPLSEVHASISDFDRDMSSPRFGYPSKYKLTFMVPEGTPTSLPGQGLEEVSGGKSLDVHWERVIHVIDNPLESRIYGVPRCQQVIDRIDDLRKLYGSSAEMYYKGAFPGLAFEGHPNMGPTDIDLEGLKQMGEEYQNGLQRLLAVLNMTVKSLAPQVKDPTPQIERQIEALCIKLPCPKRIFMGSERGELSSAQDAKKWDDQISERHSNHCTPRIVVPVTTRLINLNVLRKPKGFSVAWPSLSSQTPEARAKVTFQQTQSISQFISGDGRTMMTDLDFLVTFMQLEESEALAIVENRKKDPYVPAVDLRPKPTPAVAGKTLPNGDPFRGPAPTQANGTSDL